MVTEMTEMIRPMAPQNRIWLNDRGLIEVQVIGLQSPASVRQMGDQILELLPEVEAKGLPVLVLDDLSQMHPKQPTEVAKAVANEAKRIPFKKVAMVGSHNRLLKYGANFIIRAIGKTDQMRYFADRVKAEAWLLAD